MKLEALTVCIGYADFLAVTLPWNLPLFDKYIVGTSPNDKETIELCRRYGVHCILSEEYKRGGPFNKARLIDRLISSLTGDDWILHLDSDCILPQMYRRALEMAHLDPECIYGVDRVMVQGWDAWQRIQKYLDHQQHDFHCRVNFPNGYNVGTRWANSMFGYVPIGFHQLWNGPGGSMYNGIVRRHYPFDGHNNAARTDIQFAIQWDRRQRLLLPEVIAVHLESEPGTLGVNWAGRKTKRFEPPKGRGQGHAHGHGHLKKN